MLLMVFGQALFGVGSMHAVDGVGASFVWGWFYACCLWCWDKLCLGLVLCMLLMVLGQALFGIGSMHAVDGVGASFVWDWFYACC